MGVLSPGRGLGFSKEAKGRGEVDVEGKSKGLALSPSRTEPTAPGGGVVDNSPPGDEEWPTGGGVGRGEEVGEGVEGGEARGDGSFEEEVTSCGDKMASRMRFRRLRCSWTLSGWTSEYCSMDSIILSRLFN